MLCDEKNEQHETFPWCHCVISLGKWPRNLAGFDICFSLPQKTLLIFYQELLKLTQSHTHGRIAWSQRLLDRFTSASPLSCCTGGSRLSVWRSSLSEQEESSRACLRSALTSSTMTWWEQRHGNHSDNDDRLLHTTTQFFVGFWQDYLPIPAKSVSEQAGTKIKKNSSQDCESLSVSPAKQTRYGQNPWVDVHMQSSVFRFFNAFWRQKCYVFFFFFAMGTVFLHYMCDVCFRSDRRNRSSPCSTWPSTVEVFCPSSSHQSSEVRENSYQHQTSLSAICILTCFGRNRLFQSRNEMCPFLQRETERAFLLLFKGFVVELFMGHPTTHTF